MLPPDPELAHLVGARLRLSIAQRKRLALAVSRAGPDENPRKLAYQVGLAAAKDRLLIAGSDLAPLEGWEVPRFPLKGGAIVARGVSAGPDVARILRAVEARWVAEGFPDQARVAEILNGVLGA